LPVLHESIQDPIEEYRPGAGDCQDEHSARYGEIIFEMQQFILTGKVGVEQGCRCQTEQSERNRAQARQQAKADRKACTQLQPYGGHEKRQAHAECRHGFRGAGKRSENTFAESPRKRSTCVRVTLRLITVVSDARSPPTYHWLRPAMVFWSEWRVWLLWLYFLRAVPARVAASVQYHSARIRHRRMPD
jgi:hypothetical protein